MTHRLQSARRRLNGHDLHYVHAGEGPPIVFLHGVLGSTRVWARLAAEMSQDHFVLAPDLFGHGMSAKPAGDYSLAGHAAVVRDLLDSLGLAQVTLVGHSLGGGIALEFTYLFPDRVDRLVLVASGGLGREVNVLLRAPTLPGAELVLPLVASGFARRQGDKLARALAFVGVKGSTDVAEAWHGFEQLADGDGRRAFLATIRAVVGYDGQRLSAAELLPRLHVPTLVVWGDKDRMIPLSHAQDAVALMPDARLVVLENAGHFPHLDQPERFVEAVREFVGRVDDRPAEDRRADAG
ncbi:alpha/beta fold hydrolase [Kineosporia sp. A_224]|uniref:alpha/beta fold hydrolase n=1 Tax=Kineosporia sp. A_224 TaxID=1962180 RepID=UPI000B4A6FBB|nr:alpha/beta fold hydrolase [Kineosporia sp. A_224]